MADDSVTLALNGEVPVDQYATVMHHWVAIISELSRDLYPGAAIEWLIEDLQPGSATTTARAVASDNIDIRLLQRNYSGLAQDMASQSEPNISPKVRDHARAIIRQIGPKITSVRFETPYDDVTISGVGQAVERPTPLRALGAVGGRIQTVSSRRRLGFTLYDSLFDRAVNCYLGAEQQHMVADKWDKRVVVEGIISRDPGSGRPTAIRQITAISIVGEDEYGDYRDAAGMFALGDGEESATVTLRILRDEW